MKPSIAPIGLGFAGCWQLFKDTHPEWPWTDGLNHLVECLLDGTTPVVTPEHAYHVLEVMTQAQAAGRDGQTRMVESTFTWPVFTHVEAGDAAHRVHDRTRGGESQI